MSENGDDSSSECEGICNQREMPVTDSERVKLETREYPNHPHRVGPYGKQAVKMMYRMANLIFMGHYNEAREIIALGGGLNSRVFAFPHKIYVDDYTSSTLLLTRESAGQTWLEAAIFNHMHLLIEWLIVQGADVNTIDLKTRMTPLHYAALVGSSYSIRSLLNAKANPYVRNCWKQTPLYIGLVVVPRCSSASILMRCGVCLMEHENDFDNYNSLTFPPLWFNASLEIFSNYLAALVEAGVEINSFASLMKYVDKRRHIEVASRCLACLPKDWEYSENFNIVDSSKEMKYASFAASFFTRGLDPSEEDQLRMDRHRFDLIRQRAGEIAIALQPLKLPVLVILAIVDASWNVLSHNVPMHRKWSLIATVRHWHEKRVGFSKKRSFDRVDD